MIDGVAPRGDAYVDFLVREVVPRVERGFRIKPGAQNTAIGGSSLGAVISLYAATRYPDVFGKVLVESMPMHIKDKSLSGLFEGAGAWPSRVSIGMGGHEIESEAADAPINRGYAQSARDMDALLKAKGLADESRRLVIDPEATHTEAAWAKRLPGALKFLFPPIER
jgi:predicted alpha/beta superfamily hydrolase